MSKEELKDWIMHYLKSKDIFEKTIVDIKENVDGYDFLIKHKDKDQYVLVLPLLEDLGALEKKCNEKNIIIVVSNIRANLNFLLKNWLRLATHRRLCFYFVNNKSHTDQRWIIYPYIHNAINDRSALKKGLEALFASVGEA